MPTYQYACTACGHQLEVVQSFSDAALTECPTCEGQLRKLFSAVGIVFKGSGFYRTDSRNGSGSSEKSAPTKADSAASTSSASSDSSSSSGPSTSSTSSAAGAGKATSSGKAAAPAAT